MTPAHGTVAREQPGERLASGHTPSIGVVVVAWLMATWCVGFALVNVYQVVTDRFANGPLADYAAGLSVMIWIVFVLKLLGASVAVISVRELPRFVSPTLVAGLVWGAAALLTLYSLGSVVEAIGMITGVYRSADEITPAGVAYVLFFGLGAIGYGVLATSFSRRYGVGRRTASMAAVGAPILLALILLVIPKLLVAFGLMPS